MVMMICDVLSPTGISQSQSDSIMMIPTKMYGKESLWVSINFKWVCNDGSHDSS